MQLQVGPEYGGFWPPSSEIAGIDSRNFERTSCPQYPAMLMKVALDGSAFLHHLFCLCGEFCSCYFLFMKFMKNLLLLQLSGGGMSC